MAEKWMNEDSAREMARKFNNSVKQLNDLTNTVGTINDAYIAMQQSEFDTGDDVEVESDGV